MLIVWLKIYCNGVQNKQTNKKENKSTKLCNCPTNYGPYCTSISTCSTTINNRQQLCVSNKYGLVLGHCPTIITIHTNEGKSLLIIVIDIVHIRKSDTLVCRRWLKAWWALNKQQMTISTYKTEDSCSSSLKDKTACLLVIMNNKQTDSWPVFWEYFANFPGNKY